MSSLQAQIEELENEWATHLSASDYKTGVRLYDTNPKHRAACEALLTRVVELKQRAAAANAPPAPDPEDLELLRRVQVAVGPSGRRFYETNQTTRAEVESWRARLFGGERLPDELRTATETRLAAIKTPKKD